MAQSRAWVLNLDDEHAAAVGGQQMVEYLSAIDVDIMPMPLAPAYSPGVLVWREQVIPVIDIALLLRPDQSGLGPMSGVMILAYQDAPGQPLKHGAVLLRAAPRNVMVATDMACPLPTDSPVWQALALACFAEGDKPIPILNAQRVFSAALRDAYEASRDISRQAAAQSQHINQTDVMVTDTNSTDMTGESADTVSTTVAEELEEGFDAEMPAFVDSTDRDAEVEVSQEPETLEAESPLFVDEESGHEQSHENSMPEESIPAVTPSVSDLASEAEATVDSGEESGGQAEVFSQDEIPLFVDEESNHEQSYDDSALEESIPTAMGDATVSEEALADTDTGVEESVMPPISDTVSEMESLPEDEVPLFVDEEPQSSVAATAMEDAAVWEEAVADQYEDEIPETLAETSELTVDGSTDEVKAETPLFVDEDPSHEQSYDGAKPEESLPAALEDATVSEEAFTDADPAAEEMVMPPVSDTVSHGEPPLFAHEESSYGQNYDDPTSAATDDTAVSEDPVTELGEEEVTGVLDETSMETADDNANVEAAVEPGSDSDGGAGKTVISPVSNAVTGDETPLFVDDRISLEHKYDDPTPAVIAEEPLAESGEEGTQAVNALQADGEAGVDEPELLAPAAETPLFIEEEHIPRLTPTAAVEPPTEVVSSPQAEANSTTESAKLHDEGPETPPPAASAHYAADTGFQPSASQDNELPMSANDYASAEAEATEAGQEAFREKFSGEVSQEVSRELEAEDVEDVSGAPPAWVRQTDPGVSVSYVEDSNELPAGSDPDETSDSPMSEQQTLAGEASAESGYESGSSTSTTSGEPANDEPSSEAAAAELEEERKTDNQEEASPWWKTLRK